MNILISSNDNYVMPLTVLLQSLFDNHREPMVFWFLWSDLKEENRTFFSDYIHANGSEVHWLHVDEEAFRGLPTKKYISTETYYRLLAAELLPQDLDRILWLDADMVVNGSLQALYETDLEGYTVAACPHGTVMKATMMENCRNIGIVHPEQYFNAGVMLCSLSAWRSLDIPDRINGILSKEHRFMFPGQDLTNLIFNGTVKTENWKFWNCMTHSILSEDLPELKETARIIHFAGFAKPWQFYDLPFADVWKAYYDRTPFAGKPLKQMSYFRMKQMYEKYRNVHPDEYTKAAEKKQ